MDWIKACEADLEAQRRAVEAVPLSGPPPAASPAREPVVRAPPPRGRPRSWVFDPLGDVLFVAGLGGLGAGAAYTTIGALDLKAAPRKPTAGDYARAVDTGRSDRTIGVVSGAAGALLLGAAIWRFSRLASRTERTSANSLGVMPSSGGALACYAGSF